MELFKHLDLNYSSLLFCPNDSPLHFYIPPHNLKPQLKLYIEKGGGKVHNHDSYDHIRVLLPGVKCMSKKMTACEFVSDCIKHKSLLDINNYEVTQGRKFVDIISKPVLNKRKAYTSEDDENIIRYVAEDDRCEMARGNLIWLSAEELKITDHPWQSMRDRFLKRIISKLDTYSRIDDSIINKLKIFFKQKTEIIPSNTIIHKRMHTALPRHDPQNSDSKSSDPSIPQTLSDRKPTIKRKHDFPSITLRKKVPIISSSLSSSPSPSPRSPPMPLNSDVNAETQNNAEEVNEIPTNGKSIVDDNNGETDNNENQEEIKDNVTLHQNKKFIPADHENTDTLNLMSDHISQSSQPLRDMLSQNILEQTGSQATTSSFNSLIDDMQSRASKNIKLSEKHKALMMNRPIPTSMKCVAVVSRFIPNETDPPSQQDSELERDSQDKPSVCADIFDDQNLSNEFFIERDKLKLALEWLNIPAWVLKGVVYFSNGDLDDAIYWLLHCKTKSGKPIYTHHDDALLLEGSEGDIVSLELKYGKDGVKERLDFLLHLQSYRESVECPKKCSDICITDGKVFCGFDKIPTNLKNIFGLKFCERVFIQILRSTEVSIHNAKQGMAFIKSHLDKISNQKWMESIKMLEDLKQDKHDDNDDDGDDDDDSGLKIKRKCQRLLTFRVSAKSSGRPSKHLDNKWLSFTVGQKLAAATSLKVDLKFPDLEVFVHLNNEGLVIGLPFCNHPLSKRSYLKHNGLRSTVASVISFLCHAKPGMTLLDPMCGRGILLLEAASQYKDVTMIGCDLDITSLKLANENVSHFNTIKSDSIIQLMQCDGRAIPLMPSCVDAILCDIPFGNKHKLMEDMEAFLKSIDRLLVKDGRCVILGGFQTTKDLMSKVKELFICGEVTEEEEKEEGLSKLIKQIIGSDDRSNIDHIKNIVTSSMDVTCHTERFLKCFDHDRDKGGVNKGGSNDDINACESSMSDVSEKHILTRIGDNENDNVAIDATRSAWKQELIHYLKLGETDSFVCCFRKIC